MLPPRLQLALARLHPAVRLPAGYGRADLRADLWAGLTVGALVVPQAMAYALLAGLPAAVGLYTSFAALVVYALFGSSRHLIVGPVAIMSLLVFAGAASLAEPGTPQYVTAVAFLSVYMGLILVALGLLHFGPLSHFISNTVIGGFTSAAALIIALSQLKHLLGISLPGTTFLPAVAAALGSRVGEVHLPTLGLGLACVGGLLLCRWRWPKLPASLVVAGLAALVVYALGLDERGVTVVGQVPRGLPPLSVPRLDPVALTHLLPTALTLAFVSFAQSISAAQALAFKGHYKVDADQELVATGLAGLAAGLLSGYPPAGSFSASATNYTAGARSSFSAIIAGLLVLAALLALTGAFYYLPHAALGAVIVVAVGSLINLREPLRLFRLRPVDGWTWVVAFAATLLLRVDLGILVGVAFSLLLFIWRSAHPHLAELGYVEGEHCFRDVARYPEARTFDQGVIIRVDSRLYFANMGFVEETIRRLGQAPRVAWVALDLSGVNEMDTQALDMLREMLEGYQQRGVSLYLVGMKGPLRDLMAGAGWRPETEARAFPSLPHLLEHLGLGTDTGFALRTGGEGSACGRPRLPTES
jgi:SulP family sulfate permease